MTDIKKLNLGCGEFPKKGYINVDYYSVSKPDISHDLNVVPYPFKDNEFTFIEADHLLEHLSNPFAIMKELTRISKNAGTIKIKVPHFSRGFTHPEHKRGFDVSFPLYFNKDFKGGYQGVELRLKSMRLRWFAQPYLKRQNMPYLTFLIASLLGKFLDSIANLHPYACSKIWCFWVGGFDEITYTFEVKK